MAPNIIGGAGFGIKHLFDEVKSPLTGAVGMAFSHVSADRCMPRTHAGLETKRDASLLAAFCTGADLNWQSG